ncbi:ras-related protein Rab-7L1-like [Halichondria panicea]|uniref:ras-related protein Rab-7L1-like n=1 Tax=Halichondria panicea TaxID=6063 RepID=UPI00312BA64A
MSESVFKVLVIGEPSVGKTSMVARYCYRDWIENYKATVGADYAVKTIKWSTTDTVRLHIWDIAGQDHYRAMTRTYYKGASGCIVLFDLTNKRSFTEAKTWKEDLDSKVLLSNGDTIPCLLVANKDDLPDKRVTHNEIAKFAKDSGFFHWSPVSVKDNRNITESICQLIQKMLDQEKESAQANPPGQVDEDVLNLHRPEPEPKHSGCCGGNG